MENCKIWDHNAYRRGYYRANPDKRLRAEEKNALSLLHRLGYQMLRPDDSKYNAAFASIVEDRRRKHKEQENANNA